MRLILGLLLLLIAVPPAGAIEPHEFMKDAVLQKRAEGIYPSLRCVVCQNQAIDESNAELARDMRAVVRARLLDGDTDTEVIDYMVSRYGDFVLLQPPFKSITVLLWAGPGLFVLIGLIGIVFYFRRQSAAFAAGNKRRDAGST